MRRLLTLLFLVAVAVPAAAQDTPKPPRPPRARPPRDTTIERGFRYEVGPEGIAYQVLGRHGRLGVVVDLSADPSRDTVGALITAVTPGTPADKAGVQTGDIVVLMNGTRLAAADTSDHLDEDASRPGRRLVEMASKLHTGDTVRLELKRAGRPVSLTLVAGASGWDDIMRTYKMRVPSTRELSVPFEGGGMNFVFSGAPLANLELVKVNPGLADYFGTSEGVLVVNAPGDSSLGIRAGDVILSIGGRKPNSPSHAFRILGTYDPGESVPFEVMRMKRRISVTGKMPAESGWRARHNSFNWDGVVLPGFDMKLLRDWPGTELPHLLEEPRMQILKNPPQQMIIVAPRHRTVAT